jgi:CubicO group peptidase (beta-lactamase class C family)
MRVAAWGVAFSLAVLVVGVSAGRAWAQADLTAQVDKAFAAYDRADSPGCALGVIRDGEFIYRKGYGMGSLELGVPLTSSSVFYMGSVSKQFTAASAVLAEEQGLLSLDDDVRKYIPELPDYGRVITLREMLHHTSGLRDFLTLLAYEGRDGSDVHSEAEVVDLIARQKGLNNVPGEKYIYSNTNFYLMGVVIRRATGKSLADFAAENIFKPLGMTHTRYYDDHTLVLPGRVAAYSPGKSGRFEVDWSTDYDIVGAGGLTSSVDDLLKWDRNFYDNKLGKGTLLKELEAPGRFNNGKVNSYALGLEIGKYRGLPIVEHSGALYGYRTEILQFPEQRFTVSVLCNVASAPTIELAQKVAEVYLKDKLDALPDATVKKGADSFSDPAPLAGRYLDRERHFLYSFTVEKGQLVAWGSPLRRVGANEWRDLGTGTITFKDENGVMHSSLMMDGETFFAGERVTESHLSAAELAAYAGKYTSTEEDAAYNVSVAGGKLRLQLKWQPAVELEAVGPDEFESAELGNVVFQRDGSGKVSGLSLYSVRARGVGFLKVN